MDRLALLKKIGSSRKWTEERYQRGVQARQVTETKVKNKAYWARYWAKRKWVESLG